MAKRSSIRITKRVVDELGPGREVWDSQIKGFGVRCQVRGKSYVLKTAIQGKQRWHTIGRHGSPWTPDSARIEAQRLLGRIVQGEDPTAVKSIERIRMRELCTRYLVQYATTKKKASSVALDRMNIENHVAPLLGQRFVDEIKSTDMESFKIAVQRGKTAPEDAKAKQKAQGGGIVVRGGPGVANRCLTLLSTMFGQAELWGLRAKSSNPVKGVSRYAEKPRERFLTADEFGRLGETLNDFEQKELESIYAIAAIRLLILTGARLGEILTLQWSHVRLEQAHLRLPDSKTGAKSVFLSEPAIELLRHLPHAGSNPFVIVGRRHEKHLVDLQRPWQRIRTAAGIPNVRIHDLRHSFASLAIQNGISLSVIGKLLGHRSTETTKRYAHLEDSFVAGENDKIGQLVNAVMRSTKATKA
jgi:integrase